MDLCTILVYWLMKGIAIMSLLQLSAEEMLTTTRSVRKRLDFSRPVELEVIRECLELAVQAPTGANSQGWHFVVVTDQEQRKALGAIYRKGYWLYREKTASVHPLYEGRTLPRGFGKTLKKVRDSSEYLADHIHEAPVLLVPCIWGRFDDQPSVEQAGDWGSILPAGWRFMLAAGLRGLGTSWTSVHPYSGQEPAAGMGIPFEQVRRAARFLGAYTLGSSLSRCA